jgi:hypothetical protein
VLRNIIADADVGTVDTINDKLFVDLIGNMISDTMLSGSSNIDGYTKYLVAATVITFYIESLRFNGSEYLNNLLASMPFED